MASDTHILFRLEHDFNLIRREDFDWLITCLEVETDSGVRRYLAEAVIRTYAPPYDPARHEALGDAASRHPEFAQYERAIQPWTDLDSPGAQYQRKAYLEEIAPTAPGHQGPSSEQVRQVCLSLFDKVLAGDNVAWQGFVEFIAHAPNGDDLHYFDGGMDSLWGWQFLGPMERLQAVAAALHYLRQAHIPLGEWWTVPHQHNWDALAGYRALELLLESDPSSLENLPASLWEKWTPVIIRTDLNEDESLGHGRQLLERCHAAVPHMVHSRLKERLTLLATTDSGRVPFGEILRGLWDDTIAAFVAEAIAMPGLSPDSLSEGLRLLLAHGHASAELIMADAKAGRETGPRRLAILAVAIRHDKGRHWRKYWSLISDDEAFGRQLLEFVVDDDFLTDMTALTECDLADLYLFLYRVVKDQVPRSGWGGLGLPFLRDRLPSALAARGTKAACRELERIGTALTDAEWMSHLLIICRQNWRRNEWQPVEPRNFLELASHNDKRFVRNGSELMDAILASLKRFEFDLHGPGHQLDEVWNTPRQGHSHQYSPKDELEFCRAVHRHLFRDLHGRRIVVNREVELHLGERTDIHINAVAEGRSDDILTVVVEVKGCWHDDVMTAMESQLVDRYLRDGAVSHGIYLVGWFLCDAWEKSGGHRYHKASRLGLTLESAREKFDRQASSHSANGRDVRALLLDARWPDSASNTPYASGA